MRLSQILTRNRSGTFFCSQASLTRVYLVLSVTNVLSSMLLAMSMKTSDWMLASRRSFKEDAVAHWTCIGILYTKPNQILTRRGLIVGKVRRFYSWIREMKFSLHT